MANTLSRIKWKFGWIPLFPFVFGYTIFLKIKNRRLANDKEYLVHQKEFFKYSLLRDRSDKFESLRKRIADCALEGGNNMALDIATGHGSQAKTLKDAGFRKVIAVDLVPERIQYCQEYYKNCGIDFLVMDATKLDFPERYFDAVVVSAALHDMPTRIKEKVISEMARVSKKMVVIFEPRTFKNPIIAAVYGFLGNLADESLNFFEYVKTDLNTSLERNGLRILKDEVVWGGIMNLKVCEVKPPSA